MSGDGEGDCKTDTDVSESDGVHLNSISSSPQMLGLSSDQEKHFFVFSSAGKPIYSYHGNEESFSSIMATAKALLSVAESRSESLRYIRSGSRVIAFLDRSPICLVAASNLSEPPAVLRMQLALVHGQLISLLTASAVTSIFTKNPGFDARRLLGNNDDSLINALIDSFTTTPAAILGAFPSLPLPQQSRTIILQQLQSAATSAHATFALLICKGAVAAVTSIGKQRLQQWDILLLLNFLRSNQSLKRAETFTPLCLPSYNPNGNLHAYIQYLTSAPDIAVVLLAGGALPDFHAMSAAQKRMFDTLYDLGALEPLIESTRVVDSLAEENILSLDAMKNMILETTTSDGCIPGYCAEGLIHFAYKLTRSQQFVMSPFVVPMYGEKKITKGKASVDEHSGSTRSRSNYSADNNNNNDDNNNDDDDKDKSRRIYIRDINVAYGQIRASMFDHAGEHVSGPLQTFRIEKRKEYTIVVFSSPDYELYVTLDSFLSKIEAVEVGNEMLKWLQSRHSELFFPMMLLSI